MINGYGPTENTTFTCTYRIPNQIAENTPTIPIGQPIANTTVYILDRQLQPVPIGVPGELYVGGAGLARGYLNRPGLTAERFVSNPFGTGPGQQLFSTGDIVRYRPDGNIEFLGRRDNQVKIRGFRIELDEIERALREHPEVRDAAVAAHLDASGTKYLAAYVVSEAGGSLGAQELLDFLRKKLPEYMLPSRIVFRPALPLLPSGKLDRHALKPPESVTSEWERRVVAPRDALESTLVDIWRTVLGTDSVGLHDNFFDLGGHSLLAVRLFSEIERRFGKRLDLSTVMSAPTVAQLAAVLRSDGPSSTLLVPIQRHGSRPPLFCIHGGGGHVLRLRDLVLGLGPDQPIYGLRAPLFNGYHDSISVEKLAKAYLREVCAAQPQGPYCLAGPSFGGLIAYEMATELAARGEQVALLALFDTGNQAFWRSLPFFESLRFRMLRQRERIESHRERFKAEKAGGPGQLIAEVFRSARTRCGDLLWRAAYALCRWTHQPLPRALRSNLKVFTRAAKIYQPRPYPGRVVLFKAEEQQGQYGPDPTMGWGVVALGGVEIHTVAGDHTSMFRKPRVYQLGDKLRERLELAHSGGSPRAASERNSKNAQAPERIAAQQVKSKTVPNTGVRDADQGAQRRCSAS